MGSLFKRGKVWWVKYYKNGKSFRESSSSDKKMVAKQFLSRKEGEIAEGKVPSVCYDKVRFIELADAFLQDYRINERKSIAKAQQTTNQLKRFFESSRIVDMTTSKIQEYIETRLAEGAANATVNRELSALKRMLKIGAQQTPPKVNRVPYIPMLKEKNVRKGFFEHGQFLAFRKNLPEHLKGYVTFAYKVGWRESEISDLTWDNVDLPMSIVRLDAGVTKNDEARTVCLDDEILQIFKDQWAKRKQNGKIIPYVFPNAPHNGPICDFRRAWNNACRKAGLGYGYRISSDYVSMWEGDLPSGPILHDFRRTAVRNMVRAGVPETVAMMVSGHKTRSVFDRYNITSESDLRLAAQRQAAYLDSQPGTVLGTVPHFDRKKGAANV